MANLTDADCNRIIAKFMGFKVNISETNEVYSYYTESEIGATITHAYTKSLDALVPVWEKLNSIALSYEIKQLPSDNWIMDINKYKREPESFRFWLQSDSKSTIQQAAAHATAKAILELKND